MRKLSKNAIIGYPAGIITGIAYGLNPMFAKPLMDKGAATESILFFRYAFAVLFLGVFLMLRRQSFKINRAQAGVLLCLGLAYTMSSICLFGSYYYIASGLATTLVFMFPVIVAIIMVFLGVVPSWPVWLAIAVTFAGVVIMTGGGNGVIDLRGVGLALSSAFLYAFFVVIINRSKVIASVSNSLLTFYALMVGVVIFSVKIALSDNLELTTCFTTCGDWLNLIGLALLPTVVSTAALAVATRCVGATKASVLGVSEPITAILVGSLMFHEPLTTHAIVGITISVVAVTFMIQVTKR